MQGNSSELPFAVLIVYEETDYAFFRMLREMIEAKVPDSVVVGTRSSERELVVSDATTGKIYFSGKGLHTRMKDVEVRVMLVKMQADQKSLRSVKLEV